jgi:hypothetical protein
MAYLVQAFLLKIIHERYGDAINIEAIRNLEMHGCSGT